MIEREVVSNCSIGRQPMILPTSASVRCHFRVQDFTSLLNVKRLIPDYPNESLSMFLPVKNLAGIERLLEIEIWRGDFDWFHQSENNFEMTKHECRMTKE